MKNINIKYVILGMVLLAGLVGLAPGLKPLAKLQAQTASGQVVTLDGAADCRTFSDSPIRGGAFIINGKLFPGGTLPSGPATNDPTQPVNGVGPVGEWLVRGQHALPLDSTIAPSYSSAPFDFATQYYILNDGRALTTEGYLSASSTTNPLAITGGIGGFSGAAGDVTGTILGPNSTGCPNFRVEFHLQPGSVRGR